MSLDQEVEDELDVGPCVAVHVHLLLLELLHELLSDLAILRHFKLDLSFQGAVRGRLHVEFHAEALFLHGKALPLLVYLQVRVVAGQAVSCALQPLHAHEVILVSEELQTLLVLANRL